MKNVDSQTVNITIPKALLKQVDALAQHDYTSRSDIIRQALLDKIRRPGSKLDEWGDPEGEWKTVVDFREHGYPDGMPADEFIAILKKLNEQDRKSARSSSA